MKKKPRKILRSFRLSPEIEKELSRRSAATGITETRIIEDALKHHFASHMQKLLAKTLEEMRGFEPNPKSPLAPFVNNALTVKC